MSENRLPGDYTKTQSLMVEEELEQRNTKILREPIYQVKKKYIVMSQAVSVKTLKPALYLQTY